MPTTSTLSPVRASAQRPVQPPVESSAQPPKRAYGAPVPAATLDLLALAHHGLDEAALSATPPERYAGAHLAALRAAAALLAVRGRPSGRSSPRNAWVLLAHAAPELSEWAAFFAAGAGKRAAAEAGLTRAVAPREADDLARDAEAFLALVETTLGLTVQPTLDHDQPSAGPTPTRHAC